jgi:PAS domain S-box-containing protein
MAADRIRENATVSPGIELMGKVLLVVAAYYLGGLVGLQLRLPPFGISIIWPPNAILLAALMLIPVRMWWIYLLALLPAHLHLVAFFQPSNIPMAAMLGQFAGNVLQCVLGALAVRPLVGVRPRLDTLGQMAGFALLSAIAAPALASLLAAFLFVTTGWATEDFWFVWRMRFLTNVFATLTITPFILVNVARGTPILRDIPPRRYAEFGLIVTGLCTIGYVVFGIEHAGPGSYPALLYAPLPFLLWTATRFGLRPLSLALLIIALISLVGAAAGRGPFTTNFPEENVTDLQLYLVSMSMPLIFLTTVMQERRRAVVALQHSEEEARKQFAQLSAIYQATPIGLAFVDTDLRFVSINDHLAEIDRLPAAAHIGRTVREVLGELADQIEPLYRQVIKTGRPIVDLEVSARAAPGMGGWADRVWQVSYHPIKNDFGAILGVSAVVQEITARKRAAETLRNIAEGVSATTGGTFFRSLAVHISKALQVEYAFICELLDSTRARTVASYVNGAEVDNINYDLADTPCELVLRQDVYGCPRGVKAAFARDLLLQKMDVEGYLGVCLKDSTGKPLGLMAVMTRKPMVKVEATQTMLSIFAARAAAELERKQDEDELRLREQELRISEERYREVVESQTDLVCRYLADTTLTFVNGAYCRFFGHPREKLIGRKFVEFIPEAARPATLANIAALGKNRHAYSHEHEVILPDGTIGWQHWVDYAIVGSDGEVTEFQGIGRDITDRKRVEEANLKLAHASRVAMVGELTAVIAHELSQPLAAMLINSETADLLLKSNPPPLNELHDIVTDLRHDNLRAGESIDRMRALLRQQDLALQPLNLNDVLADALDMVSSEAMRRRVQVSTECAPELPAVIGDRVHLQQVLLNLILNGMDAMDTTPESRRNLLIRIGKNGSGTVEVAVTDTGKGISEEQLPRIFESFYTTKAKGMGMGLSIAKSIIEAHLGRIWAENNPRGGATFLFTLPVCR